MCIGMRLHVHVCVLLGLNCMSRTDPGDFRLQGAAYILGVSSPLSILLSHVPYSFSETCQTSNCIRVPAPRADTAHLQSSRRPSSVVLLQLSNPLYGVRTLPVSRSPLAPSSIIRCPPNPEGKFPAYYSEHISFLYPFIQDHLSLEPASSPIPHPNPP